MDNRARRRERPESKTENKLLEHRSSSRGSFGPRAAGILARCCIVVLLRIALVMSAKPVIVERIEAQVKAAKAAVKRSPNDATAHAQLGIAYQQLDLNRHEGGTMQARTRARACARDLDRRY